MITRKSKGSLGSSLEERHVLGWRAAHVRSGGGGAAGWGGAEPRWRFAKKLRVSRQYLCDVEKGRRRVSPEQAAKFAKAFGHPPNVLVRLALQDAVRASGLKLKVSVEAA